MFGYIIFEPKERDYWLNCSTIATTEITGQIKGVGFNWAKCTAQIEQNLLMELASKVLHWIGKNLMVTKPSHYASMANMMHNLQGNNIHKNCSSKNINFLWTVHFRNESVEISNFFYNVCWYRLDATKVNVLYNSLLTPLQQS